METNLNRTLQRYRHELYKTYLQTDPYTAHKLNLDALVDWVSIFNDKELDHLREYENRLFEKGKALF